MHGKSPCIFLYSGKQKNRAAPHSPAQPGAFRLSHDVKRSLKRVFASGARRGRSPVFSGNPDPADRPDAPLLYHKTVSHVLTHSVYCLITLLSHSYHTLITHLLHSYYTVHCDRPPLPEQIRVFLFAWSQSALLVPLSSSVLVPFLCRFFNGFCPGFCGFVATFCGFAPFFSRFDPDL